MSEDYRAYADARLARMGEEGKVAHRIFTLAQTVGVALSSARKRRDLSQRELAALSGVQQADISRIERGLLAPTTPTLLRLVEALDARITIELLDNVNSTSELVALR